MASNFLKALTAERIAEENSKIPEKMAELNKLRISKIIAFLLPIIGGKTVACENLVRRCTEEIMKLVEIGGLATEEGEKTFRDFFEKCPDKFYALAIPELWVELANLELFDLQDHIANIYNSRLMPYEGPEEHFHWAVKSLLNVLVSAGADEKNLRYMVDKIMRNNTELLDKHSQDSVWNLLVGVEKDGKYHRPVQKSDKPVLADKEKMVVAKDNGGAEAVKRQNTAPNKGKKGKNRPSIASVPVDGPTAAKTENYDKTQSTLGAALSNVQVN